MVRLGFLCVLLNACLLFTVACGALADEGDDYHQQPATAWPDPRFSANSNGTVRDNLTGLVWLRDGNCFGAQDWETAVSLANSLGNGQCGLNDGSKAGQWRLPSRRELNGLLHRQKGTNSATWLNSQGFSNVQGNLYWSSKISDFSTVNAWYVDMHYGGTFMIDIRFKNHVWPVRGGE
jgi:hypothetical protein